MTATMKRSMWTLRVGFVLALALLLGTVWWYRPGRDEMLAPLPRLSDEAELPAALRERVHAAHQAVRNSRGDPTAVRELARLYHANHRHDEARQCYELLVTRETELTAQDHYFVADLALQRGDLALAQSELQQALELQPRYVPARVALGLALLKSNETERAAREFEGVLANDPLHIDATVNLARLDLQRGNESAALNRLEGLTAARPEATSTVALLAQVLERRGESDRAAALRALSLQRPDPIAPDPWMAELDAYVYDTSLLGLRFEELAHGGDGERAQGLLHRIEEVEPGSPVVPLLRGAVAARASRHDEAVSHFRAALARGGDPEKICPALVSALLAAGQAENALALMVEQHAKQPESVPLLVAYSEVLVQEKHRPEARQILTRVLELQPYLVPQAMALAEILWAKGEYESAAMYLKRVAQVDGKHLASRALLAEYDLRRSNAASALTWLEQARALSTTDREIRHQLTALFFAAHVLAARNAMAEGDGQRALDHFDRAAEVSPEEPQVHAGRAQVLVQLGDHSRAADALRKLAELQPENPTVLLSLGDIEFRQGRGDFAKQHWEAARQLVAPGDDQLLSALDQRLRGAAATEVQP